MKIPYQQIPEDALQAMLEEFATREGTEYGEQEVSLETKVAQLKAQLQSGEVAVVFDPTTETPNLLPADQVPDDA